MNESENLPKMIGRYEIKRLLGAGAMGSVYLAEDPRIKRKLAIKVVKLDAIRNESDRSEFLARFQREAEVSGVLNDPGIVTIYDVGDSEVGPFLAMEFVTGKALDSYIKSGDTHAMELGTKLRIAAGIAAALDHAHSHGIVHRDVKPGNVMMTEDGRPKLMDFGIAKREDASLTQTGTFLGTPSYASPEQIREGHATLRSDIFSFGVLVFEMLAGTLPFPGTSINTILYKIVNEPPIDVKPPVMGMLPDGWHRIFARVLAKNADDRYPSCAAFLRDLLDAAADLDKESRMEIMGILKIGLGGGTPPILTRAHEETMYIPAEKMKKSGGGGRWLWAPFVVAGLGVVAWYLFKGTESQVLIATTPAAARVLKSGVEVGKTPMSLLIKQGEKVTLERPGFKPMEFTYTGGDRAPKVDLQALVTTETLRTTPEGAKVVMDEAPLEGATPLNIEWNQGKPHTVTFSKGDLVLSPAFKEGEIPGTQIFSLKPHAEAAATGEIKTVDVNAPGFLRTSGEFSVKIRVDSKDRGDLSGNAKLALPPGAHKIELSNTGVHYQDSRTVAIQPGQPTTLALPTVVNITVNSPSADVVIIDGRATGIESDGSTPIRIAVGRHTIAIQGKSASQTLEIKSDQAIKIGYR